MKPVSKTNGMRLLDSLGISYEAVYYAAGDDHMDAVKVARQLGIDPETVWKTLVAHDEKRTPLVFCIPAPAELNLKKAARAADVKKVELVPLRDLTPLTGYVRGGCSPLAMKKKYATWIDETAPVLPRIYVNAGARGTQILLSPEDLILAAGARIADLT